MFTKKAKDNLQAMLGQAKFSAANNTDAQALRVPSLYPEWEKLEEGTHLGKGQRVNYNNVLYNVLSAHDKQTQWTPEARIPCLQRYSSQILVLSRTGSSRLAQTDIKKATR